MMCLVCSQDTGQMRTKNLWHASTTPTYCYWIFEYDI